MRPNSLPLGARGPGHPDFLARTATEEYPYVSYVAKKNAINSFSRSPVQTVQRLAIGPQAPVCLDFISCLPQ